MQTSLTVIFYDGRKTLGAQSAGEKPPLFRQGFAICGTRLGGVFGRFQNRFRRKICFKQSVSNV
jgi:hypothetical protein